MTVGSSKRHATSEYDDKVYIKRRSEDLDELLPKKEGKAKIIEDRRVRSSYTRLDRNTPNDIELSDDKLYSGAIRNGTSRSDDSDYYALLRKQKEREARRDEERYMKRREKEEEIQSKIEKYNQREKEVQEMLKKMIPKK